MAFKNGSLISPEGRRKKRVKEGGGKGGKTQKRQEIVPFARGAFNYLIAEWMHFPQLTVDVHLRQEGQGKEMYRGKEQEWRQIEF